MPEARLLAGADTSSQTIGKVGTIVISQLISARSPRPETGYITPNGLWIALPRAITNILPSAQQQDNKMYGRGSSAFHESRNSSARVHFGSAGKGGWSRRHGDGTNSASSSSRASGRGAEDGMEGEGGEGAARGHKKAKPVKPLERAAPPELPFTPPGSYSGWGTAPPELLSASAVGPSPSTRPHRLAPARAQAPSDAPPQPRRPPPAPPAALARAEPSLPPPADASPQARASRATTPSLSPRPLRRPPRLPAAEAPSDAGSAIGSALAKPQPQSSWRNQYVWSEPHTLLAMRRICSLDSLSRSHYANERVASGVGDTSGWLSVEEEGELSPRIVGRVVKPPICPTRPGLDGRSAVDERRRLLEARCRQALRPLRVQRGEIRWRKPVDTPMRATWIDQPVSVTRCW